MRDIPVILNGYKLAVVEPPAPKTRDDGRGNLVTVTDRRGVMQFVVALFAKLQVGPGQRAPKGEDGNGGVAVVTDRQGATQFVVSLFKS